MFNERYLNPQPRYVIDSVKLADGKRCYDPKVYMDEVDRRAGKIFANRRVLPRQPGQQRRYRTIQRADCHWGNPETLKQHFVKYDSLLMSARDGKPEWWSREYEGKKEERKEWAELMNPVSMQELRDAMKAVEAGKAAGPDRLSADMLKYLFWGSDPCEVPQPEIVWDKEHSEWSDSHAPVTNAAMEAVLLLCNASTALETATSRMKEGEIAYLSKI